MIDLTAEPSDVSSANILVAVSKKTAQDKELTSGSGTAERDTMSRFADPDAQPPNEQEEITKQLVPKEDTYDAMKTRGVTARQNFAMVWEHSIEPKRHATGLKAALKQAKENGTSIPSEKQRLKVDPCLMADTAALLSQIHGQYKCEALGIAVNMIYLQYTELNEEGERQGRMSNVQEDDWEDILAILNGAENGDFVFQIGFRAVED